jgi:hypothetical protein
MLMAELFNLTGMPKTAYIEMLANVKKKTHGFTSKYALDENGDLISNPEELKDIFEKLRIIQFDRTFGENYGNF